MNISNNAVRTINHSWWLLKLTYGLLFVVAGADKLTNLIVNWGQYVSPFIMNLFPFFSTIQHFLYAVCLIEIAIGLLTLSKCTRLGAYLTMTWFALIVVNLLSMGMYFDIAVRDIVMAIGALVLAWLTEVKEELQINSVKN